MKNAERGDGLGLNMLVPFFPLRMLFHLGGYETTTARAPTDGKSVATEGL